MNIKKNILMCKICVELDSIFNCTKLYLLYCSWTLNTSTNDVYITHYVKVVIIYDYNVDWRVSNFSRLSIMRPKINNSINFQWQYNIWKHRLLSQWVQNVPYPQYILTKLFRVWLFQHFLSLYWVISLFVRNTF